MAKEFIPHMQETGEANGRPLVFFHGFPGSHLQSSIFTPFAKKFNLKILAPDRPGYGYSDPLHGKGITAFLQGLERGLDTHKIDKFYLVGVSGGNPSAICAAGYFGDRVLGLGSVCGLAPYPEAREHFFKYARTGLDLARRTPEMLMRPMINGFLKGVDASQKIELMIEALAKPDQDALRKPHVRDALLESMALARRQGSEGIVFDLKSFSSPWPVEWSAVRAPHILWHGEKDRVLSHEMSQYLHRKLPNSRLKLFPRDGHYSLPILRAEEILEDLTGAELEGTLP